MDGRQLRAMRERHHLTQAQVAAAAGMHQPELSAIENDRRGTEASQARVAAALRSLARPRDALTPPMRREIGKVLRRFGAQDVRVFGSVARGTDEPGSDLDIMATFPETFSFLGLMEVEEELEALLGIRVDVVFDNPRRRSAMSTAKQQAVAL